MSSWHSPQSIYSLGHRALIDLFSAPVLVEEKVDGSFFAFGLYEDGLRMRSKGAEILLGAPEKMFDRAVAAVSAVQASLRVSWQYRGEYLRSPKHNALAYSRVPANHVMLFDICTAEETYLSYEEKAEEATRLGFEAVPRLREGLVSSAEELQALLENTSALGGQKIEGVVVKRYDAFGPDKKALFGKYVSEAYREVHAREWKAENPTQGDVVQALIQKYHSAARWQKAVMRLREEGRIEGSPRDIPAILQSVWPDILKEEEQAIKQALFDWAKDKVRRGVTAGLAEWYKDQLLRQQFEQDVPAVDTGAILSP